MEKRFFRSALAAFAVMAAVSFTGCSKEDEPAPVTPGTGPGTDETVPVLTITTEDNMSVPAGGGSASIAYTLENEVSGGSVSASCPETADWVTAFNVETSGTVSFNVSPNTDPQQRTAEITVTYTYGENETVSDDITIVQQAAEVPEPADPPVITATMAPLQSVPYSGSENNITAYYSIENPVAGGTVSLYTEPAADWITTVETLDDRIIFSVKENTGSDARSTVVRLRYTYGSEHVDSEQTMTVNQGGVPAQGGADYEFVATALTDAGYSQGFPGMWPSSFYFTLSNASDTRLTYDIYMSADATDATIPSGKYVYDTEAAEAGTFGYSTYVRFEDGTTRNIVSGTINVTNNGDGTYVMEADFVDEASESHHVTFSGAASF